MDKIQTEQPKDNSITALSSNSTTLDTPIPTSKEESFSSEYADDDMIVPTMQTSTTTSTEDFNLENELSLKIKLKHKNIQLNSAAATTLPLLVTLDVNPIKVTNTASTDLICVLDHSGSMQGTKIELLKNSFKEILEHLSENDRLSIVQFQSQARRVTPLLRMTEVNKAKTLQEIGKIQAGGGTDIVAGMKIAMDIMKQRRTANSVTSICLLSDGLDTGAEHKVDALLKSMPLRDTFTINTFGYGADHDPKLMNAIAQLRDGNFYFVEKLDMVDECFADCLGGLISVVGQDVNLVIKAEPSEVFPNIQITKAYGVEGIWKKMDGCYMTGIPQLVSGRKKNFVLEITIPKTSKEVSDVMRNIKIASAVCSVQGLKNAKVPEAKKQAELISVLFNETEELKENEVDRDVMFNYYRVRGAEVMNEARILSDKEQYDDAKKVLQNFREDMTSSVIKDDEAMKNLIKDLDDAITNVNSEVYEATGRHYMQQNYRGQMMEKGSLTSNVCYQNSMQMNMRGQTQMRKGNYN